MKKKLIIAISITIVALIIGYVVFKVFWDFLPITASINIRRYDPNAFNQVQIDDSGYIIIWAYYEDTDDWHLYHEVCDIPSDLLITWWEFFTLAGRGPECFRWI